MDNAEGIEWKSNFDNDLRKLTKEILVFLNKSLQLPPNEKWELYSKTNVDEEYEAVIETTGGRFRVHLEHDHRRFFKANYGISLIIDRMKIGGSRNIRRFHVVVSKKGIYTKDDIEKAKDFIIVKSLKYFHKWHK